MTERQDLRMWWAGKERGWVVDTTFGLSRSAIQSAARFTLHVQEQRLTSLLPGPVRDECIETIAALKAGRVTQNIVGVGERVIFDAYKSEGQRVFIPR